MADQQQQADSPPVLYEREDGWALITLNRPEYANAQDYPLLYSLDDAFTRALGDDAVKCIILAANGKHFSAGHDLTSRDILNWQRDGEPLRSSWQDHCNLAGAERTFAAEQEFYLGLCRRWRGLSKPTIAAVQGACVSGGLMLAWVCDLLIASDDAFFQDTLVSLGLPGVEYFAHGYELPPRIAREFLLLGQRMTAQVAHGYGMVNRVVPRCELLAEARRMAAEIASRPTFGMKLAKQALNQVEDMQGKRNAMDASLGLHSLAQAHNRESSGRSVILAGKK